MVMLMNPVWSQMADWKAFQGTGLGSYICFNVTTEDKEKIIYSIMVNINNQNITICNCSG